MAAWVAEWRALLVGTIDEKIANMASRALRVLALAKTMELDKLKANGVAFDHMGLV